MQALRNIKYTLRKYFVPMLMSLVGLILAFSAFMLISVQLDFENGFDRFHPDAGNIYRVDLSDNNTIFRSILPPGFSDEVIRSSSHIVAGTVVCPFLGEVYITTMKDGVSSGFIETANVVSEDFFKVFGIKIVEGDSATLSKNEQLAIPQSMARKIFGNESPIGKQVKIKSGTGFLRSDKWTVGAVYEDLPANSQIRNEIYMKIPDFYLQNFGASNFVCYLRLDDRENVSLVEDEFNSKFEFDKYRGLTPIYLTPLVDVYFQGGHPHDTYGDNSGNCPAVAHSIRRSGDCGCSPLSYRHGNGNRKHSVQFREEFFHCIQHTASGTVRRNTFGNISCIIRYIIYRRTCNERQLQPQFFGNENKESSPMRAVCRFVLIDSVHSGNLFAEQNDASVRPEV